MKCCKFMVATVCVVMALAATALDYPVYTVTTSGDGTTLDCSDLSLLSRQAEHTLATATGGIEGMPAFDDNAPGNKGWHLVKETIDGVESLKLFWQLGLTITIH